VFLRVVSETISNFLKLNFKPSSFETFKKLRKYHPLKNAFQQGKRRNFGI